MVGHGLSESDHSQTTQAPQKAQTLRPPSPSALRDELDRLVMLDLLGPAGGLEEEVHEGNVRDRYLVGMLAPSHKQLHPEELDKLALAETSGAEDGPPDPSILTTATLNPSSIGLSFCVDASIQELLLHVSWGLYQRVYSEEGVAVLMRYTLRLLTFQQFQRASALLCACEVLRRSDSSGQWGQTPFRLGLWVGQRTTPNTTEQSEDSSKRDRDLHQRGSTIGGIGSPYQLTNCPWCGTRIEPGRDIRVDRFSSGRGRTFIFCGDATGDCLFGQRHSPNEGLPVLVVDEEIYRCLPSLLIATVDKFAQMPRNGATQMLFGQVDKKCSRHGFHSPDLEDSDLHRAIKGLPAARSESHAPLRPPDLIIQDELHLISGPLGTLVGLYESVVDRLCTWEVAGQPVRPKVIAATATIRRAPQQVEALFLRQVRIFPPNSLDIEDNFFARQRVADASSPGRRYISICASGRRLKAALIRVYVAYLSAAQYLYQQYGRAADPWMTLVGYFDSMSELGGMRRLVEDDMRSRLSKMERRGMAVRHAPLLEELTSRKSSTDIPRVLDLLECIFDPATEADRTKYGRPLDVLLATNMISVGVDVKRLGLIVVTGQPKTTAEYIQATSRVGRNHPGLAGLPGIRSVPTQSRRLSPRSCSLRPWQLP